jgi:hypothetical protein
VPKTLIEMRERVASIDSLIPIGSIPAGNEFVTLDSNREKEIGP